MAVAADVGGSGVVSDATIDATFAADTLHGMDVVELEKKIDLLNKAMPKSKAKARIVLKGCHNFKKIYFRWKRRNKPGKCFLK